MLSDTRSGSKIRDEKKGTRGTGNGWGGVKEKKSKRNIVAEHFEKSPDKFGLVG